MATEGYGAAMGGFASGMAPWLQRMMYAKMLQNATPAAAAGDPMMAVLPGTASWAAAAGNRPLTNAVPTPYTTPIAPAVAPATVGTGTTPAVRPLPVPPISPGRAPGTGSYAWPPFTNAPANVQSLPTPYGLNAGDVGSGSLLYQPGGTGGMGAFGNIIAAPGRAANFQNQFGFGLPGTNQAYRKWFTERYGMPPQTVSGL